MGERGTALRRARFAAGMSQQTLAKLLNLSPQYLCDMELGKREFSEALIERLPEPIRGPVIETAIAGHLASIKRLRELRRERPMTDIEKAARAIRRYVEGSEYRAALGMVWRIHDSQDAGRIVEVWPNRRDRDERLAEWNATAVIESVLLEPSEAVVEAAIWAACPELKPWTEGEHVKVPVVCQRCPASVPIMGGKDQGLPACRAFAEHIVRPALRAAALAILGRDGSAG